MVVLLDKHLLCLLLMQENKHILLQTHLEEEETWHSPEIHKHILRKPKRFHGKKKKAKLYEKNYSFQAASGNKLIFLRADFAS